MKQKNFFRGLLLTLMMLVSLSVFAYEFTVDGIRYYYHSSSSTTVNVTCLDYQGGHYNYYNKYSGDIVIPSSVTYNSQTYSVTSIGDNAFRSCSGLTSITIPNSVTTIGSYAFGGCSSLTSIIIPNNVTSINEGAFMGCNLAEVIIGTNVTSIGNEAFSGNEIMKTIWLPNTPPSGFRPVCAGQNYVANEQYKSLRNVTIYPFLSSVFEIDGIRYVPVSPSDRTCDAIGCVYDSTATNIKIGNTVTYRGIEMNVNKLQPYLCYKNDNIESVDIDYEGDIPKFAFSICDSIQSISIDASAIGENAFSSCTNLTNAILGKRITSIGTCGFAHCRNLQNIILPDALISLGNEAFVYCSSLTSVHIGSGLKKIENGTFYSCSALPAITIPANVTSIADGVFQGCANLAEVNIVDRTTELSLGYNPYNSKPTPLFADCPLKTVYIGGNITYGTSSKEGYSPFYRNTTLETVTITDKETEISENEFYGCTGLKSISMGDGVESIGNWAFSGCASMESFKFGSGMKLIGQEAFSDCMALTSLESHTNVPPTCGANALDDINKWSCQLHVPKGTKAQYAVVDQWKDFFFVEDDLESNDNVATENANAYNRLNGQIAELQIKLDAAKETINTECKDVAAQFAEQLASIQNAINALQSDIDTKYANVELTIESTINTADIVNAIATIVEDAMEAQKKHEEAVGIYGINGNGAKVKAIYSLDGKRVSSTKPNQTYIIKYSDGRKVKAIVKK